MSLLDLLSDWVRRPVTLSSSTYTGMGGTGETKAHELDHDCPGPTSVLLGEAGPESQAEPRSLAEEPV